METFQERKHGMEKENGNIKNILEGMIRKGLEAYSRSMGMASPEVPILIERPAIKTFGDFATNIAMQTAGIFKKNPMAIAEGIKAGIGVNPFVKEVSVAKPGFINFHLAPGSSSYILNTIWKEGERFGKQATGKGKKVLIEFMSANPTGPLHIGHARNAILGDSIARALEAGGYEVTREYYYNDAGVQMKKLGLSLRARYLQELGRIAEFPEDGYKGEYMIHIARDLISEKGDALATEEDTEIFTHYAACKIIKLIDEDLKCLGIRFDNWFSESSLHEKGKVAESLQYLKDKDMLYEKEGAWWLRTQAFGDEKDRVVIKSDGEKTYLAPDIAYHKDKLERGYDLLINVLGGDHHGYVPRLKAGVQALGYDARKLQCIVFQMVSLLKDGETIKLSTRSGRFITLREVVEELGVAVVRFFFLMRSSDSQMTFDWQLAKDHSMNNPVYYIQYAHARCCSLFKKAEEMGIKWQGMNENILSLLTLEEEENILKILEKYPETVQLCIQTLEPHHITTYLRELAGSFHNFFTTGTKEETKRIIIPQEPVLTQARLCLVFALKRVLGNALHLIGIEPLEQM
ncbi:arginine--tRNA ligase [Candidatus Sumerlaeota bacterium]|nr:arginine--tRNA ligase [Candidatus Sumerlaeota bacterium]